jgi:transposase-like protein
MVQRLLMPNAPSAAALSKEVGVPQPTLSLWKRKAGTVFAVSNKNTPGSASRPRRPEDWSAQERLRVVNEASRLSEAELGEFLRREGLHEETLLAWRKAAQDAALEALQPAGPVRARGGDRKRIKQLERELARKDKALAEAAALLVLKKRAQAIWGDEDDDTNEGNDK